MFNLSGKTALVTGATGGIGKEIAVSYIKQGAKVGITGTSQEKINALVATLGSSAIALKPCNMMDHNSIPDFVKEAEASLGQIDILVNNAGITKDGLAMRMKQEDFKTVIDVNLVAPFILIQAVMRGMMKRESGRIINITSIVGTTGNIGQANYSSSKGGLIALTKTMARELATRKITVNAIAPGFIETAMTSVLNDEIKSSILASIPMNRMGSAEEIASMAVFLASNEASYITGQILHVNGGMYM